MSDTVDLHAPGMCKLVAERIKAEIDAYCEATYDDGHRTHLGASLIGHECARYLWYTFRWAKHVKHGGRMQRLFNRGHREEERFTEWLRGIGFTVWTHDENGNQFRIVDVNDHFGGSLDAANKPPERYRLKQQLLLGEFKTSGTGAGFVKLQKEGVRIAKPQHFDQMSMYGYKKGVEFAVYMCINKNDDDLHVEVVKLDWQRGADNCRKAEAVINATEPPPKIASQAEFFKCKYCDFAGVCWRKEPVEVNCRSCVNARAVENAAWFCSRYNSVIPKEHIPKGCPDHAPIS